ncbi:T3SS effector NleG family protein [Escherichia coli]|uniref:T3SS effector NleG family protein n=1 Tax=Escherichia coli TaxID=562 RepID=UPI0020CCD9FA|nr:T3SS effector NleG family protein [Escherichia coli]MCQ0357392.1 T3SS effector NleG family protein [Escherichia coli]
MQPVGASNILPGSLLNESAESRNQTTPRQTGEIRIGNEMVAISHEPNDAVFFGVGRGFIIGDVMFSGLSANNLLTAHSGVREVRHEQENVLLQARISECAFSVSQEKLQCPEEGKRCPVTLETPETGVFVKNSEGSLVCTLFDSVSISRLVREGGVHPLTRETITPSMIVKPEDGIFDSSKGNFIIKDG